ncbi:YbaY family lipoprotein [Shewanella olleyana]|uniref:YbaY family lipoprotein n=1 Tax=Shewanella olleyana TaxID=135626 RepID=UPI00200BB744|nr:YbaY family lipoprotein [Shewanella olleyana]MCL1068989.1 YbaY family lipoprotein [Shewanella olleyana]
MNYSLKAMIFGVVTLMLTACVTVTPDEPIVINGYAGYLEKITLPAGCRIDIAIIDLNTPGLIISQKNFDIARAPVPFKFTLPHDSINDDIDYGVVAMISYQGKVIFQTYDKFPVINNDKFTTEVIMKKVDR